MRITVVEHKPGRTPRLPYKVMVSDDTGFMDLVFFRGHGDYLRNSLPVGEQRYVSGKVERYDGRLQMAHPERMLDEAALRPNPPSNPFMHEACPRRPSAVR
jgi:ATP-dependent DNA helicase RecG